MIRDFVVNVNLKTTGVSERGFGTILILDTTKDVEYTLCGGIEDVAEEFAVEDKAYKIATRIFGQNPAPQEVAIAGKETESETELVAFLNNLIETESDWFFLVCSDNDNKVVKALSGWIDTQEKMYFATTQDLELVEDIESDNTAIMYHDDEDAFVAEGLASYLATAPVGGVTAKFKTINGVTAANIGATELKALHKNGGFSYIKKMGVLQTTEGYVTSGSYIDLTMGSYFVKFRIEEEAMLMAVNNDKIPYSNTGIGMLVGVVDTVLKRATLQGIVLEEEGKGVYEIAYIPREDMPKNKIANREYDGVRASATIAGAIHNGTINIDLVL